MNTVTKAKTGASNNVLQVQCTVGQDPDELTAKAVLGPTFASAITAGQWSKSYGGGQLSLMATVNALEASAARVNRNDLTEVEARLMAQATALDTLFAELSRTAARNIHEYPSAFELYMKLALKAQNQCRMTLETLATIKNPPVVYAKQANISSGPQQVNNGPPPRTPATETETKPTKLVEAKIETTMDSGTTGQVGE